MRNQMAGTIYPRQQRNTPHLYRWGGVSGGGGEISTLFDPHDGAEMPSHLQVSVTPRQYSSTSLVGKCGRNHRTGRGSLGVVDQVQ